ncbi:RAMP superfamily CRISPR-associated protein [Sporomusa termitida]|uniref:CRISPR-associated RAMP protein, Csx10 family n=1 Tax=Sporomusa termitida TaxID=2377 RepID=A0A517DNG4_9FIRM|nr:RAMP superfamily CRISPR-associated protein [Sporomusa termitida]QDR78905.1 CRISPR-associated RAMP protein, Csx10 family [Sporomusa termitida]
MECYLVIEIINQEPLKIGAGGSKASQREPAKDYIPGSTIRGAFIGRLKQQGLFASAWQDILLKAACHNAYPYRNGRLYLPAPQHLRLNKHDWRRQKALGDQTAQRAAVVQLAAGPAKDRKNTLPYRFLATYDGVSLSGLQVAKEYRLHHNTSRNPDREERDNLFRYEAIAAGQVFRTVFRCDQVLAPLLPAVFPEEETTIYLGGSKSSGYGLCRWKKIDDVRERYQDIKPLLGLPAQDRPQAPGQELWLTCLSDVLVRNRYGQPENDIPAAYIESISGEPVSPAEHFVHTGISEGYNATWQARYPKETTIKAGSVLHYTFDRELPGEQLQAIADQLEGRLVGERTQDGFGWLGVNLFYPEALQIAEQAAEKEPDSSGVQASWRQLAAAMEENEHVRNTWKLLAAGLDRAKKRWLQKIFLTDEQTQEPAADRFLLSPQLKRHHLQNMNQRLNRRDSSPDRPYMQDSRLCSIADCPFIAVLAYVTGAENAKLACYGQRYLQTASGQLFYAGESETAAPGSDKQRERKFILELLAMGLAIRIGRKTDVAKADF